jgi:hypothetical protein
MKISAGPQMLMTRFSQAGLHLRFRGPSEQVVTDLRRGMRAEGLRERCLGMG